MNGLHVKECVHPESVSCRGCEHSFRPDLYDGGCRLHAAEAFAARENDTNRVNRTEVEGKEKQA